jgi:hypothetical protein
MPAESFCDQIWPLSQKCWPSPGLSYYNKGDEFLEDFSQQLAVLFLFQPLLIHFIKLGFACVSLALLESLKFGI